MENIEQKAINDLIILSGRWENVQRDNKTFEIERWEENHTSPLSLYRKSRPKIASARCRSNNSRRNEYFYKTGNISHKNITEKQHFSPSIINVRWPTHDNSKYILRNNWVLNSKNTNLNEKKLSPIRIARPIVRKGVLPRGKENVFVSNVM